jgi:hypothetical protein
MSPDVTPDPGLLAVEYAADKIAGIFMRLGFVAAWRVRQP